MGRRLQAILRLVSLCVTGMLTSEAFGASLVRLVYVKEVGAESCPGPMQLRLAVAAQLGYDPFNGAASQSVIAHIRREGDTLVAKVDLVNLEGQSQGARELSAPANSCSGLIRAVALTVSIAIDPTAALGGKPTRRQEPPAEAPPAEFHNPEPPALPGEGRAKRGSSLPPPGRVIRYFSGAGAYITLGQTPVSSLGADIFFGGRIARYSLSFEGRVDIEREQRSRSGVNVGAYVMQASLVPCLRLGHAGICGVVGSGLLRAAADEVRGRKVDSALYSTVGARLEFQLPVTRTFGVGLHADGLVPLPRQRIEVNGLEVWSSPAVMSLVGVRWFAHY